MTVERGRRYVDALCRVPGVLDALELALERLPDGAALTPARVAQYIGGVGTPMDHCTLALTALADLNVVPAPHGGSFNRAAFVQSGPFRAGARMGIDIAVSRAGNTGLRLVQALPGGLPTSRHYALQHEADDLRAAIVDVIISARDSLVLASPFWDDETADELGDLLVPRVQSGVRVDLLGRPPQRADDAFTELARRLSIAGTACAYIWSYPMEALPFGTQTFHFKTIVADGGAKAYLGSANFTTASLRSRMELGVLIHGGAARTLARIMTDVLTIARPYHEFA